MTKTTLAEAKNQQFTFTAKVWLYPGKAGWQFVSLPTALSKELDYLFEDNKRGFGSLKVEVTVGETVWSTSIFPDKKSKSYLLPLKAHVRKQEQIQVDKTVRVSFQVIP